MGEASTWLPRALDNCWQTAGRAFNVVLGDNLPAESEFRQGITTYLHAAGIQSGYGFFAPNIPSSYKLVFELHYPDDRVEYELPRVDNEAVGLRFTSLLEQIGHTDSEDFRDLAIRMLCHAMWIEHPDAIAIRAVFGYVDVPALAEAEQGKSDSYHVLYSYDFSFSPPSEPEAR